MPYSRSRTLERLFRGEHPDSGRHIGVPRRIPCVLPLSRPTPNGALVAPREPDACLQTPPAFGPKEVVSAASRTLPLSPGLRRSCSSPCLAPPAPAPPASVAAIPLPNGTSPVVTVVPQEVGSASTHCPAVPPSLLEVSLLRAASRLAAKETANVEGRPRSLVPSVLLHPSAHSAPDPCLGSRPGSVGVVISRRGRFRF